MRQKDTELMNRIRDFAEDYYTAEGRSPTTTEIAAEMGIARGTAYKYLLAMDERGLISYDGKMIVTDKIERMSATVRAEVYTGAIPCGGPEAIEAAVEDYVSLPSSIFGTDEMYVLHTHGSSMIEIGIDDGDLVVVKKQQHAKIGEVVVALHNNESTLKTLLYDNKKEKYILHPENSSMQDIEVENLVVQGVAKFVIKAI